MPLVPMELIKQWYHTDSFVYRQFAYLFNNPLWQKPVPRGFALCPFWWAFLFSLLLFRPFVWLAVTFVRVMTFLRVNKLILWTDRVAGWVLGEVRDDTPRGIPTAIGSMLLIMMSLFVFLIYIIYGQAVEHDARPSFWLAISLIAGLITWPLLPGRWINARYARYGMWGTDLGVLALAAAIRPGDMWWVLAEIGNWFGRGGLSIWHVLCDMMIWTWQWSVGTCMAVFTYWWLVVPMLLVSGGISYWLYHRDTHREWIDTWRLRATRAAWHKALCGYIDDHCGYSRKRIDASKVLYDAIWDLVSNLTWLRADLKRFHAHISEERCALILRDFEDEQRRSDEPKAPNPVTIKARAAGKQVLTLLCVLWELVKARKQGWCPYLPFEGVNQPAPQPHQVVIPANDQLINVDVIA